MSVQPDYQNSETQDDILGALEDSNESDLPQMSASEQTEARHTIASEEQPDGELPDLRVTETVDFRGHDFEFTELGELELEATQFSDVDEDNVEEGSEAAKFAYRVLGESSVDADEAYWRQYSLTAPGDTDGIMDLFTDVVDAFSDVDPEELEQAGNSR